MRPRFADSERRCYRPRLSGAAGMKDYRLYYLDRLSGHIDEVEEIAAASDSEAIALATQRSDQRAKELWHRHHKLKHWGEAPHFAD